MKDPFVSIIVPVYNVEKFLRECIDSILAQSFTNFELILVDDGSIDNCPVICDEYADKDHRVKVIHKPNGGISSARNAGIDIARGNYIGFVDSDDLVEPDMYEKLIQTTLRNHADLCLCRVVAATEEGERKPNNRYFGFGDAVLRGNEVLEILVKGGSTYYESVWNKLYRRELFAQLRFLEGKYHEDAFLIHHIYGLCSRIVFVEDALYIYRLRSNSIMRAGYSIKRLDVVDAYIDRVKCCISRTEQKLAAYAILQSLGKTLEVWMTIPPRGQGIIGFNPQQNTGNSQLV